MLTAEPLGAPARHRHVAGGRRARARASSRARTGAAAWLREAAAARAARRERVHRRVSCWPPPACSTAGAPRRIGATPRSLARQYPAVRVEPDRIFVRDGKVWTSAGITAGIDLALALIAEDLGEAVAKRTAQRLVVYHRRPGGQSQFSALLEARTRRAGASAAARLGARAAGRARCRWSGWRPGGDEPAQFRPRLRRRDRHDAGQGGRASAPGSGARRMSRTAREPIDRVAAATGFGDPERMRRAFIRAFGQPPQALRRAARAA